MAKQESDRPGEQLRPFTPSFPFYLVYGDGMPVLGNDGGTKFVMACATLELGELVTSQFHASQPRTQMELRRIADREGLSVVARLLVHQGVTHMSWNATRRSTVINVV